MESTAAKEAGPIGFARMSGTSIAGRDAAAWITDFLNAACYRRPVEQRDPDDLRLAFCILTTYWHAKGKRLHVTDLSAFHSAFGGRRFDTESSARGLLSRDQLLDGGAALLGAWFPDAYADPALRGWGIAFASAEAKAAYDPESRLKLARLGELTPERGTGVWHTYPEVPIPSCERALEALAKPETWPDYASEIGRFTPLRAGGLLGQTFEIDVAAGTESGRPLFTRGYVTITRLAAGGDAEAYFAELEDGLARYGDDEPRAVPEGGTPVAGFDLTTHAGHFMGSGHNRLILFEHDGRSYVRAAGTWDRMPWYLDRAYRVAGQEAQHAFWGQGNVERLSMLHQLAKAIA